MARHNTKATLVRYAKTESGWRRGTVVVAKNGRVNPAVMMVNGATVAIDPKSIYQIRFYEGSKARYSNVGFDYEAASQMLEKYTASRQLEKANGVLGIIVPTKDEDAPKTLAQELADYLTEKRSPSFNLSYDSIHLYESTLSESIRFLQAGVCI